MQHSPDQLDLRSSTSKGRETGERKGAEGWAGDKRGWEEMDASLFKLFLNTPLTLLQGPALCLDSLLMLQSTLDIERPVWVNQKMTTLINNAVVPMKLHSSRYFIVCISYFAINRFINQ